MPVIIEKSIHSTPKKLIDYILNPDKNEEMKYVTGFCCHSDSESAYEDFRDIYERFTHEKFSGKGQMSDKNIPKGKKRETVLLFHYVQSFLPGEVDAELAHKIGVEFAWRVWPDRAVLVSTHDDKKHPHNHFAVSVFDNKGKRWYANKESTRKLREASDKLAKKYGLSVIEPKKEKKSYNYAEWLARKSCTSWKEKIADELDRLVNDENVKDLKDLMRGLSAKGYIVNRRKYLSIRPRDRKQGISSYRLGDGYSVEALLYRIEHKEHILTDEEIRNYPEPQRDYARCLRDMQLAKYRHSGEYHKATYEDLMRMSALLFFIVEKKITSNEGFMAMVNETDEKYRKALERKKELEHSIEFQKSLIEQYPEFIELFRKKDRTPKETERLGTFRKLIDCEMYEDGALEKHRKKINELEKELSKTEKLIPDLKAERNAASDNYKTYIDIMPYYEKVVLARQQEEARREAEEAQRRRDEELLEEYFAAKERQHARRSRDDGMAR